MYYLIIFIIIIGGYLISRQYPNSQISNVSYWILYLLLAVTAGLRYETGTDYFAYQEIYNGTNTLTEAIEYGKIWSTYGNAEIGYMLVNSLFRTLGVDVNIMFLFISFFTLYLVFKSISDYCYRYRFLIVLAYYCFCFFVLDLNATRQTISVSLFLYSLRYIIDRKVYKYLLCTILAILFHTSAIIILPLYWIINKRISNWVIYSMTFFGLVIILLKIPILEIMVLSILEPIFSGSTIIYKLMFYSSEDGLMLSWGFNPKVIIYIAILIFVTINRKKIESTTPHFNIILNLLVFYVFIRQLLWESADMNSRINYYFIFGLIAFIPNVLSLFTIVRNKLVVLSFVLVINFYQAQTWFLCSPLTQSYNPYQNYIIHKIFDLRSDGYNRNVKEGQIEVKH